MLNARRQYSSKFSLALSIARSFFHRRAFSLSLFLSFSRLPRGTTEHRDVRAYARTYVGNVRRSYAVFLTARKLHLFILLYLGILTGDESYRPHAIAGKSMTAYIRSSTRANTQRFCEGETKVRSLLRPCLWSYRIRADVYMLSRILLIQIQCLSIDRSEKGLSGHGELDTLRKNRSPFHSLLSLSLCLPVAISCYPALTERAALFSFAKAFNHARPPAALAIVPDRSAPRCRERLK